MVAQLGPGGGVKGGGGAVTTEERNALCVRHLPLVGHVVSRLRRRSQAVRRLGRPEAFAAGCLALVVASRRFDPARGVKFLSYAFVTVWREVGKAALNGGVFALPNDLLGRHVSAARREAARRAGRVAQLSQLTREGDRPFDRADGREGPGEAAARADEVAALLRRANLTPRERELILLHYCGDLPLRKAAAQMGVCKSRAGQLLEAARAKLLAARAPPE